MVLVGVQPRLIQVPPTSWRSISAVFFPAATSAPASGLPPCPEPMTMASKASAPCVVMVKHLEKWDASKDFDAIESEPALIGFIRERRGRDHRRRQPGLRAGPGPDRGLSPPACGGNGNQRRHQLPHPRLQAARQAAAIRQRKYTGLHRTSRQR